MGPTELLRPRAARALGAAMVAIGLVGLLTLLGAGTAALVAYAPVVGLFGAVGWAAFWRPYVEVSDGGVRVANTWRTVDVAWPALREVEGRYGLRLLTAHGPLQAWGAQAPSGGARAGDRDSVASGLVRERWDQLRSAGHLDGARLEQDTLPTTWHHGTIALVAVLTVWAVAAAVLG